MLFCLFATESHYVAAQLGPELMILLPPCLLHAGITGEHYHSRNFCFFGGRVLLSYITQAPSSSDSKVLELQEHTTLPGNKCFLNK
jgi:hypothetical protein